MSNSLGIQISSLFVTNSFVQAKEINLPYLWFFSLLPILCNVMQGFMIGAWRT